MLSVLDKSLNPRPGYSAWNTGKSMEVVPLPGKRERSDWSDGIWATTYPAGTWPSGEESEIISRQQGPGMVDKPVCRRPALPDG
jgi:hypothetical protein